MAIGGKYNFRGIKRLGATGLKLAIASNTSTAWMLKLGSLLDLVLELIANFLANKGLIILNLGAINLDTHFDQKQFDAAIDTAIDEIKNKGGLSKLTPEQIKAIDDDVIKAARKFVVIARPK